MSTKNRGDRIQLLQKVVTKHFTPVVPPDDRTVLEHLLYACCLEDAPYEAADEAFHRLQESFFDWNEVRVTTVSELRDTLHALHDPSAAAMRIKRCLQSIFETRYSFDLQELVKMNQGKAVQELEKLAGISRFVLAYVTQHAFGGHAIPVSDSIVQVLLATEIVSESEVSKGQTPSLERTISKNKGAEVASCLHQLAVLNLQSPTAKQTRTIMKEAGAADVKKEPPAKSMAPEPVAEAGATDETDTKKPIAGGKPTVKKPPAPIENPEPTASSKKAAKKPVVKTPPAAKKSAKAAGSSPKVASPKASAPKADGAKATKRKPK